MDIGREYYEGEYEKMQSEFIKITNKYTGVIAWKKYKYDCHVKKQKYITKPKTIDKIISKTKSIDKTIEFLDCNHICNKCEYSTDDRWCFRRHLTCAKHKRLSNNTAKAMLKLKTVKWLLSIILFTKFLIPITFFTQVYVCFFPSIATNIKKIQ